ncbi:MAG: hypothetical protein QNK24_15875 [Desulfuromusa sp.]|nr:hypothetical protein [Desulfuromusa sp.]
MMRPFILLLAIGMLFGISSPALADETVSVKVGYQWLEADGKFSGNSGDTINMDDLDYDKSEDFIGEIALHLGNSRLSFSYMPLDFSGKNADVAFDFNGENFTGSVDSKIKVKIYEAAYTYYLLNFDDLPTRFQLGVEGAIKYADGKVSVDSNDVPGLSEKVSGSLPIPTIGARSRIAFGDYFGVAARVGYMEYSDNHYLDLEGQIEFSPIPMVGAYAGYRYLDIDIDESDLYLNATFEGPFAGVFVRF